VVAEWPSIAAWVVDPHDHRCGVESARFCRSRHHNGDHGALRRWVETPGRGSLTSWHWLIGRLLDTFVAAQLRPLIDLDDGGARLHHLRQRDGRYEIDLVIEYPDGRVVGLEVTATAGPRADDAGHLAWMRDQLGERFIAGVVLHTGRFSYPLGERILAAPISVLWSPAPRPR